MSDEKNLDNEIIEAVEIFEDELNETTGGAMTVPSQRMHARCVKCGHTFYALVPLDRAYKVGCSKCGSGNVILSQI